MRGLDGAVVLVTGAQGGVGRAICRQLTEVGARVIATDLNGAPDANAEHRLAFDVGERTAWDAVAAQIDGWFGGLDALVNNAGLSETGEVEALDIDRWRALQRVNVESIFHSIATMLPLLRRRGAARDGGASVVNMSSIGGLRGSPFNAAYTATKGAVTLLTKSSALEFAALGYPVRVNSVHPGPIDTPMMEAIFDRYAALGLAPDAVAARDRAYGRIPLRRLATPADVAAGVLYLCSTASGFVTGSEHVVDGGMTC